MPRTARASRGGYCYHVINRGSGRAEVFHKEADYRAFLKLIGEACERLPLRIVAYCLMPNHFHLALWPHGDGDLRRSKQRSKGTELFLKARGCPTATLRPARPDWPAGRSVRHSGRP